MLELESDGVLLCVHMGYKSLRQIDAIEVKGGGCAGDLVY